LLYIYIYIYIYMKWHNTRTWTKNIVQLTWLNYLFHSISICHWCQFVYKISTKNIKIHTFLSSWKKNSNEKGDTWVQHFILNNYLKKNKLWKFKSSKLIFFPWLVKHQTSTFGDKRDINFIWLDHHTLWHLS
jgi:hypothetical protein